MSDSLKPKITALQFLKYTYWGMPYSAWKGWTFLFLYFLPALYIGYWHDMERYRLDVPPKFEELTVVEGTAEFHQSRNKPLQLRLKDGKLIWPVCNPIRSSLNPCTYIGEEFVNANRNKEMKMWVHPIAGALQIQIDGRISSNRSFDAMSRMAMDTSSLDNTKQIVFIYLGILIFVLPVLSYRSITQLKD
jgi:hypothetical protein